MKRLESEVLETLQSLGETQQALEHTGLTVDPHQPLGIDLTRGPLSSPISSFGSAICNGIFVLAVMRNRQYLLFAIFTTLLNQMLFSHGRKS